MNSEKVTCVLEKMIPSERCEFLGTFPRDLIPKTIPQRPACLVVNTDESGKRGEHWVAIYYMENDTCEFFDSYGLDPLLYGFSLNNCTFMEGEPIQSIESDVCGQHCIYFLYNRSLEYTFKSIVNSFSVSNTLWNDMFVKKFVSKISKNCNPRICEYNQQCISKCLYHNIYK